MPLLQNLSFILLGEDRSASKSMEAAESTAQRVTGSIGAGFSKLGGIIGGEFGEILNRTGDGVEEFGKHGANLAKSMEVAGGVITGAGIALLTFGSGEKQASDQLDAAIKASGGVVSDYKDEIEKAVQAGQNFDHESEDTKKALTKLTEATGSTEAALSQMGVVTDLAAAKHVSLEEAAGLVAKILGGSGAKVLAQYGVHMEKAVDQTQKVASAQVGLTKAQDTLAAAQLRLQQLQEIDAGKKQLSISDTIALQNATDKVAKAQDGLSTAQDTLTTAQTSGSTQTEVAQKALDQLAAKLNGQAKASVDNFGSQVDIVKTKIVDWAKGIAGPLGTALTGIGPLLSIAGVAVDIYKTRQTNATIATLLATTATKEAAVATDVETVAQTGLNVAMDANPIGLVAGALGVLAGVITGGLLLSSTQDNAAAVADYTGALQGETAAIKDNLRAVAAKQLLDSGALQAASELGISGGLLIDSVLGVTGATDELNGKLTDQRTKLLDVTAASDYDTSAKANQAAANAKVLEKIAAVSSAVGSQTGALKDAKTNQDLLNGSLDNAAAKLDVAERRAGSYRDTLNSIPSEVHTTFGQSGSYGGAPYEARAAGGIVTKPQINLVGESGPEAIIPLNAGHIGLGGGGGATQISISVPGGFVGSETELARKLMALLVNARRTGAISGVEFAGLSV